MPELSHNLAWREVWHATKTRFNPIFFHEMPCTKSGKWPLLHYSSFQCVLRFGVVSLLCRSSLIFDTFSSVLVCNPDLFFFLSIYEFWTAVYYCCLYFCKPSFRQYHMISLFNIQYFLHALLYKLLPIKCVCNICCSNVDAFLFSQYTYDPTLKKWNISIRLT